MTSMMSKAMIKENCDGVAECSHQFDHNNCCIYCDQTIDEIEQDQHKPIKTRHSTIVAEIKQRGLPEELKNKAIEIYNSIGCPVKRGDQRKLLLLALLYQASLRVETVVMTVDILNAVGATKNDLRKANNLYTHLGMNNDLDRDELNERNERSEHSEPSERSEPIEEVFENIQYHDPMKMFRPLAFQAGLDETIVDSFSVIAVKEYKKRPTLVNYPPAAVAAALLIYLMSLRLEEPPKKNEVAQKLKIPWPRSITS